MSPRVARRAASAALTSLVAALLVLASAAPAGAHSVEGGELPAPTWLLAYGGAFAALITAAVLQASWPRPRPVLASPLARGAAAGDGQPPPAAPRLHPGHALGTLAFVAVVAAAIIGPDSAAANVAPVAVLVGWWVGLPIACLLLGDVMAHINPFQLPVAALTRLTGRRAQREGHTTPPAWTAAAFLAAFSWFFLAYHRPGSPRALAVFLIAYAVAAIGAGLVWGRGWLARGEGFGGLSAAVAQLSWRARGRRVVPGLAALMIVWIGGTAFDAVTSTSFWGDVLGSSWGWGASMLNTVGLVWLIAIVAGVYLGAIRVAERSAEDDHPAQLARALGLALVPLAVAWFLTHDLTLLLAEGQNLVVLISDPIGRGWDLFGTIDRSVDFGIVEERWVRWVQLALLAVGHVLAVVLAHDVALRLRVRRLAMRATWAVALLAAASITAAVFLVLG